MKPTAREQYAPDDMAAEATFLADLRQDLALSCARLPPGLRARLRERRSLALAPTPSPWPRPWPAALGAALAMSGPVPALLPPGVPLPAGGATGAAAPGDLDRLP